MTLLLDLDDAWERQPDGSEKRSVVTFDRGEVCYCRPSQWFALMYPRVKKALLAGQAVGTYCEKRPSLFDGEAA